MSLVRIVSSLWSSMVVPICFTEHSRSRTHTKDGRSTHRMWNGFIRFVAIAVLVTTDDSYCSASIISKSAVPQNKSSSGRKCCWGGEGSSINMWNFRSLTVLSSPASHTSQRHTNQCRGGGSNALLAASPSVRLASSSRVSVLEQSEEEKTERRTPSLQELRSQLGPLGILIANAVEVGVVTAGSFLSGGIFGYVIGGAMNLPVLIKPGPPPPEIMGSVPQKVGSGMKNKIANWNGRASMQAKSWAKLSASFSGFHALTRVCRGGREDKWNSIIGSAGTGAFLSRKGGPQAMIQGAASYAGFAYILDNFFGARGGGKTVEDTEFDFADTPVEERGF